jgi:predicted enzyme related to lactoylglutathione lyase
MSTVPKANLQLIYVSDISRSTDFYKKLFEAEPAFSTPRYVAFGAGKDALFALWTGGEQPDPEIPRYSEIGIMLPTSSDVDMLHAKWQEIAEINIVRPPYDEVFGRTFLVKDPDGHLIRVSPLD